MSVELLLKLLERVPYDYFELQTEWGNKRSGHYRNFDGKIIAGVQFKIQFDVSRNDDFPIEELFRTIEDELKNGKYVIISLLLNGGWYSCVVYDQLSNGEFRAVTRGRDKNEIENVCEIVRNMKGTDILTYTIL